MATEDKSVGGFYQPDRASAEFTYWAKMPTWDYETAAALFIGYNPRAFGDSYGARLNFSVPGEAREKFWSLKDLTKAASWNKQVARPETPAHWLDWAQNFEIPVPPALEEQIRKWAEKIGPISGALAQQKPPPVQANESPAAADVGPRERESMLKIIIGMALAKYKFDPKALRSPVPKTIETDLEKLGVGVNDDTIRKYLREGADLLPPPLD